MYRNYKVLAFALLGVMVVLLAVGTVVEKLLGSFAYTSPYMVALWAAIAVVSVACVWQTRLYKRPVIFAIHASFLVILLGALVTWLTKEEGRIVLEKGDVVSQFTSERGDVVSLPFEISLDKFEVVYYPATNTPADFVSEVMVKADGESQHSTVSMNKPLSLQGYRLFQSGYDAQGGATVLMVTYDPYGTTVTYFGYVLLLLSFVAYAFSRATVMRVTLSRMRRGAVALVALCFMIPAQAANAPKVLPQDVANSFCDLLVFYNGRVCMAHTLARDFTMKISGKTSIDGFSAEQVFTGWMFFPDSWNEAAVVKVKSSDIRKAIGMNGAYTSAKSFFDDYGIYRLQSMSSHSGNAMSASSTIEIDEKINLINSLTEGKLLKLFPYRDGESVSWYGFGDALPDDMDADEARFIRLSMSYFTSLCVTGDYDAALAMVGKLQKYQREKCGDVLPSEQQLMAENVYNQMSQVRLVAALLIMVSLIFLVNYCARVAKGRPLQHWVSVLRGTVLSVVALYITTLIALRWYVSGHVPMSNGYETMLFMSWCAFPLAFILQRYSRLMSILAMLMSGLCLMVASISQMNPQISPLVPVLQSPLLCLHVAVVMLAYCLLAFMMLVGLMGVVMRYIARNHEEIVSYLAMISQSILVPAVIMLAIGIFLGAVWAGFSWGRYWGWDPKEVWALITLLVYSLPLHTRRLSAFTRPLALHIFLIVAFFSVLITYFGVNYLLGGLHSYA